MAYSQTSTWQSKEQSQSNQEHTKQYSKTACQEQLTTL